MPSLTIDRLRTAARGAGLAAVLLGGPAQAAGPFGLFAPCEGDCAVAAYGGHYVEDSMIDIFGDPIAPTDWDFTSDTLVAATVSRHVGQVWRLHFEPELGIGQRFGEQDETELWAALFIRYRGFPWDGVVTTSFALSTGLNWATGISEVEQERARDKKGSQLMHYFAPEITFALPSRPNLELMFRLHHRSGVFGLISDAWGGAQYGTVGLRMRF